jgi:hypothetical protein
VETFEANLQSTHAGNKSNTEIHMNLGLRILFLVIAIAAIDLPSICEAQTPAAAPSILARHYQEGEKLIYHMKATNKDRVNNVSYEIDANGTVKKNAAGNFVEEYAYANFIQNGKPVDMTPAMRDFRQNLSLDSATPTGVPNLSQVVQMVGPITDMLTFYADLWLAVKLNKFSKPGDHFYFDAMANTPNSWADGTYTIVGEDVIAFDFTLTGIDNANKIATLEVRHVPPPNPQIKLPAEWMRTPVADTPNNWVELQKSDDGKYSGQVGKEVFDAIIKISLVDGKILSATLDNPVEVIERDCTDLALTKCGDPMRYQIRRQVEITLQH